MNDDNNYFNKGVPIKLPNVMPVSIKTILDLAIDRNLVEKHIGETYTGMISSIMSFGIFVELPNLIEGLVPIKDMPDFFHYDEERMTLTGERSHIRYAIGDKVVVKVIRASKEDKTIDFEVVRKV